MHERPILHEEVICEFPRDWQGRRNSNLLNEFCPAIDAFGIILATGYVGYSDSTALGWTTCREIAYGYLSSTRRSGRTHMGYWFNPDHYHVNASEGRFNIARWFWYIEGHMGWDHRTKIHPTNMNSHGGICEGIVHVEIAPGWLRSKISKSLLTLMLRLAPYCHEGISLDEVLLKHPYSSSTLPAIHRFLSGHQYYVGSLISRGWVLLFRWLNCREVEPMLISSDVLDREAYYIWQERGKPDNQSKEIWHEARARFNHNAHSLSTADMDRRRQDLSGVNTPDPSFLAEWYGRN